MEATQSRPNILFLFPDQHSPHVIGCEGNSIIHTPNLDRLAREGVYFENAYCQNPLCVPSRCSVLTGKYSRSIGIYDNKHILEHNCDTIPRTFTRHGYRTCLIGKAHFNGEQFHGYQQRPYGDLYGQAHQPDPERRPEFGESGLGGITKNTGPSGIPLPLTQTEICVSETAKWLQLHTRLNPDQPFFLSVNFDKPHFPYKPPAELYRKYAGSVSLPQLPENHAAGAVPFVAKALERFIEPDNEKALDTLVSYYACVEWVDDAVGRILETLEYLGLAENTIVVYTSDHGDLCGEHGLWNKSVFFEASSRVPLIVRWPETAEAGKRRREIVGLIDLFPTLCEVAGIPTPVGCEGESLVGLLKRDVGLAREYLFSESALLNQTEYAGCMLRTGKWKYNYYLDSSEELYDMEIDSEERDNLADAVEHREMVDRFRAETIRFWRPKEQESRFRETPMMRREKHFYFYSNQFITGDGTVVDAKP